MIRNDIKQLKAYHAPNADGRIKLDAMENPFPMPEALRAPWLERIARAPIHRYPDASMQALREKIAARDGVSPEQVLIGNGSDEIIQMLLIAADAGACVCPRPSFVMYSLISRWLKRPVAQAPLERDFSLDADQFLKICGREKAEIAFLACPNNPTGNLWPEATIRRIADNFQGLLVIDEAYAPFAERHHAAMIDGHVAVLRTFSKIGWAGLRFGYLLGDAALIEHLNKVRLPYNINTLTQISADFLLDHFGHFEAQAARIRAERGRMLAALMAMDGADPFPSQTNFLLVRVPDAEATFRGLLAHGILVKNLHGTDPLLEHCLRITIGTPEENDRLLAAMKEILP
ncbi:MAG: histidinol-phosphate transaminase [Mariprofundaceae bacterium]